MAQEEHVGGQIEQNSGSSVPIDNTIVSPLTPTEELQAADVPADAIIYARVVGWFENKFGWLGRQCAENFLNMVASYCIERDNADRCDMRLRTHLLLTWDAGWTKSAIMRKFYNLLGAEQAHMVGRISEPAVRGSVDTSGIFCPPVVVERPFMFSTEFGATSINPEVMNILLLLMEEGIAPVRLNVIARLEQAEREAVENQYEGKIAFTGRTEFTIKTNFCLVAATHDPEAMMRDPAFRSRFTFVRPEDKLTGALVKRMDRSEWRVDNNTVDTFRMMLSTFKRFPTTFTLPDEFYNVRGITPRISRDTQAFMLARQWWGLDASPEFVVRHVVRQISDRAAAERTTVDTVCAVIENNPLSYAEISEQTRLSVGKVIQALHQVSHSREVHDGVVKLVIRTVAASGVRQ